MILNKSISGAVFQPDAWPLSSRRRVPDWPDLSDGISHSAAVGGSFLRLLADEVAHALDASAATVVGQQSVGGDLDEPRWQDVLEVPAQERVKVERHFIPLRFITILRAAKVMEMHGRTARLLWANSNTAGLAHRKLAHEFFRMSGLRECSKVKTT